MDCHVSKIPVLLPTDDKAVYVVTGANRGIGLEHARQFLEKTNAHVVCTVRKTSAVHHLQAFRDQGRSDRLLVVELDTTDESSIQAAAEQVDKAYPQGIDVLLNNAGNQEALCRAVETSGADYTAILAANVVGPFLVTKHFLPLLMKKNTRVVVNSSSICGSISATVSGGIGGENPLASVLLPYNTSKAALNMQTAVLANDLKDDGFTIISLHPGWVRTDMGHASQAFDGGTSQPPLDVLTSVAGQRKVILGLSQKQNGMFLNWNGEKLDW
ncbi:hypothetical protein ABBQ32_011704 [Trebouxia sp. C0010 RCD-2024]